MIDNTLNVRITDVVLSDENGNDIASSDAVAAVINHTLPQFGDANGDGKVDVADIVSVVNYLSDSEIWDVVDFNERVDKDSIPNVLLGDANNSGTVNVTDITTVADYLFGNYPSIYNFKASDVNLSRSVNVADIAGIVNVIYGGSPVQHSPARNLIETISNGVELSDLKINQGGEELRSRRRSSLCRLCEGGWI